VADTVFRVKSAAKLILTMIGSAPVDGNPARQGLLGKRLALIGMNAVPGLLGLAGLPDPTNP
jgi:hypothetical protein